MERECFENEDIARIMNEHFVNIKVDREERPDLDAIYMDAVQAMTGSGGWPTDSLPDPAWKPFYGGTYFPPRIDTACRASPGCCVAVSEAYRDRRSASGGRGPRPGDPRLEAESDCQTQGRRR